MKIAVTFFNSKKERKYTKDINNIKSKLINNTIRKNEIINKISRKKVKKNSNIKSIYKDKIDRNNYIYVKNLVIVIILSTIYFLFNTNTLFLSSNLNEIKVEFLNRENLLALNNLVDKSNYKFNKRLENKEEEQIANNDEYLILDEIARNYNEIPTFSKIDESDITIVAENQIYQKINVCGIEVVNYSTNRAIDFVDIINSDDIYFSKKSDSILMYTTHTSESYANSEKYVFDYTSSARTTDGNFNMLSIATELSANMRAKGINNICSLTPHDYGEYNSAYINSRTTASYLLSQNEDVALSIDVHRDAIEDLSFAPRANIRGLDVASLMLVMGIGYDDAPNEYYMDNLKLAFKIQLLANKVYPGLFRQIIIRNSVYNQDLNKYSFLVEVGATGNTIDEAKLATRCLSNLINLLYKD